VIQADPTVKGENAYRGTRILSPTLGDRLRFGSAEYNAANDFLIEEVWRLDNDDLRGWLTGLTTDILYCMPIRRTMSNKDGNGFQFSAFWLYEDIHSLKFKIDRLYGDHAYSEDPRSRTRRLVTNIRVHATANPDEYVLQSAICLRRNRADAHRSDTISARRDDIVRKTPDGWKLAQRVVLMDQAVLGTPNLTVFF